MFLDSMVLLFIPIIIIHIIIIVIVVFFLFLLLVSLSLSLSLSSSSSSLSLSLSLKFPFSSVFLLLLLILLLPLSLCFHHLSTLSCPFVTSTIPTTKPLFDVLSPFTYQLKQFIRVIFLIWEPRTRSSKVGFLVPLIFNSS